MSQNTEKLAGSSDGFGENGVGSQATMEMKPMGSSSPSLQGGNDKNEPTLPPPTTAETPKPSLHPSFYVIAWITMSSAVILYNKYLLDEKTKLFPFPIFLTSWHLGFASLMTQILARATPYLDDRKKVPMNGRIYLRAIMPIGLFFSLSLICGNQAYLYLSVSFIQMLKATTPVVVLIGQWVMGLRSPDMKVFLNVSAIVIGVVIASIGEIYFVFIGFVFQVVGLIFEATRLLMVEKLLSSPEYKMSPLVSLYYYAPICAIFNGVVACIFEVPLMSWQNFERVGPLVLLSNAGVAFLLNVSVVFLIGRTSSLVMTLCGVLKDIILIVLSCILFQTPVTPLQLFGYSISLMGLIIYKTSMATIREQINYGMMKWSDFGARYPHRRKLVVLGGIGALFVLAYAAHDSTMIGTGNPV